MQNSHTFVAKLPVLVAFFATFLGAFLLFFIQPLWGRHLVMAYGGTATVWNVLLFVFQALLFAGYLVVFLSQFTRLSKLLFGVLMLGAFVQILQPMPDVSHELSPHFLVLMKVFMPLVLPVLLLSLTTPFIQRLLGENKGEKEHLKQYNLYSFSNAGSFLALFGLPLVLLPFMPLDALLFAWRIGVGVYVLMLAYLAFTHQQGATAKKPALWHADALKWFVAPFLTTGLLHAYAQYTSHEIANLPLVWVLSLGIFLLSFVVAFSGVLTQKKLMLSGFFMVVFAFIAPQLQDKTWVTFAIHLGAFTMACLFAHGQLYKLRPTLEAMPLFYLVIAFAGMVAGLLNAQVFPNVLTDTYEYPAYYLLLILSFMALYMPGGLRGRLAILPAALVLYGFVNIWAAAYQTPNTLAQWRNFYGGMKVVQEGGLHVYYNNGTAHEYQDWANPNAAPDAYLKNLISADLYKNGRVGVIGMGPGNTACYSRPDQYVDFYEINPQILAMADNPKLFTFRELCKREGTVTIGDGRLAFPQAKSTKYDVIVNTAHNGFTLPLHLITKEAFEHYAASLKADGVLLMIVPERYFKHHNALVKTAEAAGFKTYFVPNSLYKNKSYPYSWYAFYKTDLAEKAVREAVLGVWRPAHFNEGKCATLTDQQHSFLQLAGIVGETCK